MKSVVACTPLNSIFTGFNHRPQWFQADTTVRSIKTWICCVTRCSQRSSFGSTSKASLKSYSQFPGSWQQQHAPRPPPFSPPSTWFMPGSGPKSPLCTLRQRRRESANVRYSASQAMRPPVLQAGGNFVVSVEALILIDLFKGFPAVCSGLPYFVFLFFIFRCCRGEKTKKQSRRSDVAQQVKNDLRATWRKASFLWLRYVFIQIWIKILEWTSNGFEKESKADAGNMTT